MHFSSHGRRVLTPSVKRGGFYKTTWRACQVSSGLGKSQRLVPDSYLENLKVSKRAAGPRWQSEEKSLRAEKAVSQWEWSRSCVSHELEWTPQQAESGELLDIPTLPDTVRWPEREVCVPEEELSGEHGQLAVDIGQASKGHSGSTRVRSGGNAGEPSKELHKRKSPSRRTPVHDYNYKSRGRTFLSKTLPFPCRSQRQRKEWRRSGKLVWRNSQESNRSLFPTVGSKHGLGWSPCRDKELYIE